MPKLILITPIIFLFPFLAAGQAYINCGGVNKKIQFFSKGVPDNLGQLLIDKNILKPISLSSAQFEMRYIVNSNGHETTLVIRCNGNLLQADRYEAFVSAIKGIPKNVMSEYKSLGKYAGDSTTIVLYKVDTNIRPRSNLSWDEFFGEMIKNHLFDIPDETVLDKLAEEDNPKAALTRACCGNFCELKAGDYFRNFSILSYYGPTRRTAKYFKYRQNLLTLITPFFN